MFKLSVTVGGSAPGAVTSDPPGLTCSTGTCDGMFPAGSPVHLTAAPGAASVFLGWSTDCVGAGACTVTMDKDHAVAALFGIPGQALWVKQLSGMTKADEADVASIAADSDGDLIAFGQFATTLSIGSTTLPSAGNWDLFVAKLSASTGDVIWAKRIGGTGADRSYGLALDASNNIYLTGTFENSVDFGNGIQLNAQSDDAFVVKLDTNGGCVWSKQIGGAGYDFARSIAVHGATVAATGTYVGSMTINGVTLMAPSSTTTDGYVVTFGTDGSDGWAEDASTGQPRSVAVDSSGNVVVAGYFTGTGDFSGTSLTSKAGDDIFLAKYAGATGALLFVKGIGGAGDDVANVVSVDPSDNIFMLGSINGTVDFGGPAPLDGNSDNLFVAKYTLAGAYTFAEAFGGTTASLLPKSAFVDAAGDLAIAGGFCGTVSFGGPNMSSVNSCSQSDEDVFAASLSGSDGSYLGAIRAGGTDLDIAKGITETSDGHVYLIGTFDGFAEFGGQGLTAAGTTDGVVMALAPL